jgi:hypothetical protein
MLTSAFPRFRRSGDSALFGSVLNSQLAEGGSAVVTMRSLDPGILEVRGNTAQNVQNGPNGSAEVRFSAIAKTIGRARVQMSARLRDENRRLRGIHSGRDPGVARERSPPMAKPAHRQRRTVAIPGRSRSPASAACNVELSSTAMVGLGEGARYLRRVPVRMRGTAGVTRVCRWLLASDLAATRFVLPGDSIPKEI